MSRTIWIIKSEKGSGRNYQFTKYSNLFNANGAFSCQTRTRFAFYLESITFRLDRRQKGHPSRVHGSMNSTESGSSLKRDRYPWFMGAQLRWAWLRQFTEHSTIFLLHCLHQKMRVNREWFIEWKCSFNFLISVPNKGDLFILFFFYSSSAFVQRNQFPRGFCESFAVNFNTLAQVNSATRLRLSALISRKPLNTLPMQQAAQTRNFCYLSREHFPSPLHRPDHRVTQSSRQ